MAKQDRGQDKNRLKPLYVAVSIIIVITGIFIVISYNRKAPIVTDTGSDPVKGAKDAVVTIVEYSDFQCPACGAMYPIVEETVKRYPDRVRVVYKNFPLTRIHKHAYDAALAGECAFKQGRFWEFHDILFQNQKDWSSNSDSRERFLAYAEEAGLNRDAFKACMESKETSQEVDGDIREGKRLNINSTPTFFINGKRYVGVWGMNEFDFIVRKAMGGY